VSRYRPKIFGDSTSPQGMSRKQEASAAKVHGGRLVPGSGCSFYAKGDVRQLSPGVVHDMWRFLFECKTTGDKSIRITSAWLTKITREAMAEGLEPALEFEIRGGADPICEKQWVAIPRSVFTRLQMAALESNAK